MKVRYGAHTDTGRVRDHNEDTLLARPPVFAVADGMGGHEAGEVASSLAVATVQSVDADPDDPEDWVGRVVDSANTAVFAKGTQRGGALRMGTTLTVAYAAPDAIYLGHVGDSRAYLLHEGRLRQLTDDHSLVAEWVRQGRITADEAAIHPQRSVITRALGIDDAVQIDTLRVVPAAGDRLLLCSDGLTGCVSDADIAATLRDVADPDEAAQTLIEQANTGGGDDNITAVVVDVVDDPVPSSPPPRADTPSAAAPAVQEAADTELLGAVAPDSAPEVPAAAVADVIEHAPPPEREPPAPVQRLRRREQREGARFWVKFGIWAVVFLVLVVGGWIAVGWFTSNAYFVGTDGDVVAIYRGIPESVFGSAVDAELLERSPLRVEHLPEKTREDLTDGIKADSREEAERVLAGLASQATVTSTTAPVTTVATTVAPSTVTTAVAPQPPQPTVPGPP
ncbi:MAG: Stp1/IreP family PP2C-type Ser/Thr phosphatase [Acidimicrobiia bacterium]